MVQDMVESTPKSFPEFFNQLESFPWLSVGKRACGPTVVAMAINRLSKVSSHVTKTNPLDVAWAASKANKLPGNQMQNKLLLENPDGTRGFLTVGDSIDKSLEDDLETDQAHGLQIIRLGTLPHESDYQPVFTLKRGWDHRGSERFFAERNIEAEQFGDKNRARKPLPEIIEKIESGNMIIGSVKHDKDSTHVVLITDHDKDNNNLLIHDPLTHGPQWVSAEEWYKNEFNGYGTLIHKPKEA